MYNEQLEKLIEMAIVNGFLTDKQREILLRKADSFSIDLDEFEMVLESRLYEKQQNLNKTEPSKTELEKKSETIESNSNDNSSDNIVKNLYEELLKVESEERNRKKKKKNDTLLNTFFGFEDDTLDEHNLNSIIYKRKASVVSALPVPSSKSTIIEILAMAVSETSKQKGGVMGLLNSEEKVYYKAWRSKAEQIITKAKYSLNDDKEFIIEIKEFSKKLKLN